ncbi:MAG: hypothetical protein ACOCUI_00230 [bacterium]
MKIPSLAGKDYDIILSTVKEIVKISKKSDEEAKAEGNLIKYIIEIYNKKDIIEEVQQVYSNKYIFEYEIIRDLKISNIKYNIRGPFPLYDGALADSKLNRWEIEKNKEQEDKVTSDNIFNEAEDKNYKYGYIVYEKIMGVKRFIELKFTNKALPKYKVDKMLNATSTGNGRIVKRIKIKNGEEKIYK